MKPWEETWIAVHNKGDTSRAALIRPAEQPWQMGILAEFATVDPFVSAVERAKLAAQAPAMARVLIAIRNLDLKRQGERHFPVIDDLLRDAGVIP